MKPPYTFGEVMLAVAIVTLLVFMIVNMTGCSPEPNFRARGVVCIFAKCAVNKADYVVPGAYAAVSSGTNAPRVEDVGF